jgi:protoporphyrinogen oxidase
MAMEKVIIIGAGPAGLSAAYELLKKGEYDVTVIEASEYIGGLARNAEFEGNIIDLGGHRFYTNIERIRSLWNEIMSDRKEDWLLRPRHSRIYYAGGFIDYPVSLSKDTILAVGVRNAIGIAASYCASLISPRNEENLENLYINQFGEKLYQMFFKGYTIKACGADPKIISAAWGRKRVRKLSVRKIARNGLTGRPPAEPFPDTEEFQYPRFGPGEMWQGLADMITSMGGRIILSTRAEKILMENGKIESLLCSQKDQKVRFRADWYISSMSLRDLGTAIPSIPDRTAESMASLPYRSFITFAVQIPRTEFLWGSDIKDTWIYVQQKGVKMGRIQIYSSWSPDMVADSESILIGAEYFCFENDDFWNMSEDESFCFVRGELVKLGIVRRPKDIIRMHREKLKNAYPGYYGSFSDLAEIRAYLRSVDNLICIGRNGLHEYLNMDEAMLSGMKAADFIASSKKTAKET